MKRLSIVSFVLGVTLATAGTSAVRSQPPATPQADDYPIEIDYRAIASEAWSQLARSNPERLAGYDGHVTGRNRVATTDELVLALGRAEAGDTIVVEPYALLDLSRIAPLRVPPRVTLASERASQGPEGCLLFTSDLDDTLLVLADGARLVGLCLMGPDPGRRTYQMKRLDRVGRSHGYYSVPNSVGVMVRGSGVEIHNCDIWGWSSAGVHVAPGSRDVRVHHCVLHHNQRDGLGYGVYLDESSALIEANVFDWCRHAVAGSGRPGTSYEAAYNVVLPNMAGHVFDMHGGADREDGTDVAGDWFRIHHNLVAASDFPAVAIRGIPREFGEIRENSFRHPDLSYAVRLFGDGSRVTVASNRTGAAAPAGTPPGSGAPPGTPPAQPPKTSK